MHLIIKTFIDFREKIVKFLLYTKEYYGKISKVVSVLSKGGLLP